ncbi:MAG: ComEC family competence protein [Chloroflexi bacterium]|nr:ComEC family competence protein [Chloroflexota bacterium]
MPLLTLGSAWLAGVAAGSWAQPPLLLLALVVAGSVVALARARSRTEVLSGLALAAFTLGLARYEAHTRTLAGADLARYLDEAVVVTGLVDEAPDRRARSQRLVVAVRSVQRGGREEAAAGRVLVTLPPLPEHRYGDLLRLHGRLEAPPTFPDFDYRDYLYRQGISAVLAFPRVEVAATGVGAPVRAALITLRERLADRLAAHLPEPHAALAQGIVLGQRAAIPPEVQAAFARTGTTHLLAVSGQNLTIAAALAVAWGSRAFGRRHPLYYLVVLGSLWGYTLLVGGAPPVLRAALMATLLVAAAALGRPSGGLAALVAAAALMVGLDPLLLWNVSFS